jgi:hypothetical protein
VQYSRNVRLMQTALPLIEEEATERYGTQGLLGMEPLAQYAKRLGAYIP